MGFLPSSKYVTRYTYDTLMNVKDDIMLFHANSTGKSNGLSNKITAIADLLEWIDSKPGTVLVRKS